MATTTSTRPFSGGYTESPAAHLSGSAANSNLEAHHDEPAARGPRTTTSRRRCPAGYCARARDYYVKTELAGRLRRRELGWSKWQSEDLQKVCSDRP